jgi:hypothetical protein
MKILFKENFLYKKFSKVIIFFHNETLEFSFNENSLAEQPSCPRNYHLPKAYRGRTLRSSKPEGNPTYEQRR